MASADPLSALIARLVHAAAWGILGELPLSGATLTVAGGLWLLARPILLWYWRINDVHDRLADVAAAPRARNQSGATNGHYGIGSAVERRDPATCFRCSHRACRQARDGCAASCA